MIFRELTEAGRTGGLFGIVRILDRTALDRLNHIYSGRRRILVRSLMPIVGSLAVAEDLAQETYLKVRAALAQTQIQHLEPFLFRTARNLALDHLRRERRQGAVLRQGEDQDDLAHIAADTPSPEAEVGDRQLLDRLEQVMSRLTPRQRRVMVACRLESRSYAEVAADLGVSTSTVQKDLKDAMAACLGSFTGGER